ncbi:MAG: AMP-dependent synthetase, partial [Clostridia bacterium]|nr:AMP-dependent synthetase [Clostridia bacterium]
ETLIARIDNVTEVLVYEEDELIVAEIFSDAEGDKEKIKEQIKSDVQKVNSMLAGYKQVKKIKFRSVEFEKTTTKKIKRAYKN